jgi:hypothetical protein
MIEVLSAVGIFLVLFFVATGSGFVHWSVLLVIGAAVAGIGFVAGVVAGIGYHVTLYRALAPLGLLGPGWWWRPTGYNARLPDSKRPTVMGWFYVGVASVIIDFAGCVLILGGILIM